MYARMRIYNQDHFLLRSVIKLENAPVRPVEFPEENPIEQGARIPRPPQGPASAKRGSERITINGMDISNPASAGLQLAAGSFNFSTSIIHLQGGLHGLAAFRGESRTMMTDDKSRRERIREATEMINSLLERRPKLRPYQEEIERRLRNAGTVENRLAVLGFMIHEQVLRFDQDLSHLMKRIEAIGSNLNRFDHIGDRNRRSGSDRRVYSDPSYSDPERRRWKDRRAELFSRDPQKADCAFP